MDLHSKISALKADFESILATSGSPSLSLGVLHQGEPVLTQHFGQPNISKSALPDNDTIYHVASLTKVLSAAAVGVLIEDGILDWDVPIREYLPAFRSRKDEMGVKCTLRDLLSNRTGLAVAGALWGQQYGEFLMPRHGMIRTATNLNIIRPFRKNFIYSNWNWCLVQEIIEAVTGKTFHDFTRERITGPLNMSRTTMQWLEPDQDDNIALAYSVKNDSTPSQILFPDFSDPTGSAAGAGMKSTIRDLLVMYQSLLKTYSAQRSAHTTSTPGSPFKQLETIFTPHIGVSKAVPRKEAGYCLGMYRTCTPGNLSVASMNTMLLGGPKKTPQIGTTKPGVEIYHHTGTIPGFLASYFLIPASESAVVVLTNSFPLMDPTDWIAQSVVALLLGETPPTKYPNLAKSAVSASFGAYAGLQKAVAKGKSNNPPSLPQNAYVGEFWNRAETFFLAVTEGDHGLHVVPQNMPNTHYDLQPYDGDTFCWPVDREEELCKKGMWPHFFPAWHKMTFGLSADGRTMETLTWHHDAQDKPEVFRKHTVQSKL